MIGYAVDDQRWIYNAISVIKHKVCNVRMAVIGALVVGCNNARKLRTAKIAPFLAPHVAPSSSLEDGSELRQRVVPRLIMCPSSKFACCSG